MGQKINPYGFRLSLNHNWKANWYSKKYNFSHFLMEDFKIRNFLKSIINKNILGDIIIERLNDNIYIIIYTSKPNFLIGKNKSNIINITKKISKLIKSIFYVYIKKIKHPKLSAKLISHNIADQLEKRVIFKKIMKKFIRIALKSGALGIKIMLSGRLNGAEIARKEWYSEGRIPLHTLNANIDYNSCQAKTTYGIIGVKVWIYINFNEIKYLYNYLNK